MSMEDAAPTSARCWILTVGDELVNGMRVDTNTAWLAGRLSDLGIRVDRAVSVGDEEAAIREVLTAAGKDGVDVVVISGGLGPTQDDRTKPALAAHFGADMERIPEVEEAVRAFFRERDRTPSQVNLDQALVPEGFEYRVNPVGTAPGLLLRREDLLVFALPGVPPEMKALYHDWAEGVLKERFPGTVIRRRWYRTTGIGESDLFNRIGGLEDMGPSVRLAYLPGPDGVSMYVTATVRDSEEAERLLDTAEERIREGGADYLYGRGREGLPEHVGETLRERSQTLAVAESCTGGLLGSLIADVPGASEWFLGGWITYSNEAKRKELGVPEEVLAEHGAVSEETARAMAEGARGRAGTDWALSITGIAGPTGGTQEKPVGTVCIGCAGPSDTRVRTFRFGVGGRRVIRERSAAAALDMLRRRSEGLETDEGGWVSPR
ncbi:MAG: competence/damage-inducible protein A [bacterium]